MKYPDLPESTLDSFSYEAQKQKRLKEQLESEGFASIEDPADLYDKIGTVQEVEVHCQLYTPRLLLKVFAKGCENLDHSFFLVPLWQVVKFHYLVPQPNEYFTGKFVIGVRRVSEKGFVPSLRLPLS